MGYVSYPDYLDLGRASSLVGAAAFGEDTKSFGYGAGEQEINALFVSRTFMPLLGVHPAIGRFFEQDGELPDEPLGVVLGEAFWKKESGGSADALGKVVRIGTRQYTIIGVTPRGFNGVGRDRVDVYLSPAAAAYDQFFGPNPDILTNRRNSWLTVIGRAKDGLQPEAVASELTGIYRGAHVGAKNVEHAAIRVISPTAPRAIRDPQQVQDAAVSKWLWGMAAIVLLIACANVANLLLARTLSRRREIAVRLTLGVGRARLMRQLITESLLLAFAGGAVALLVANWGGSILRARFLSDAVVASAPLDSRILLVTLFATVLMGLACGLAPAIQATRPSLTGALKWGAHTGTERRGWFREILLVGQIALTLTLLVGAVLFERSLRNVRVVDVGVDVEHVLRVRTKERSLGYSTAETDRLYERLSERLRSLPGVERVTVATGGPFGNGWMNRLSIPGRELTPAERPSLNAVDPDFFSTLGIALRQGRIFSSRDVAGAERVAVVNESMAQHFWPSGNAIGQCIKVGADTVPCTIVVGVVQNSRQGNNYSTPFMREPAYMRYFLSLDQRRDVDLRMIYVRSAGPAVTMVPAVRRAIQEMVPDLPFSDVTAFSTALEPQIRPWRLGATMFGVFGSVALAMALVGLYGVLAYSVGQRTHEIGVRVALGGSRGRILWLVVGYGMRVAIIGLAIGALAAVAGARTLAALLYGVSASDPQILAGTAAAFLVVAMLASFLPARRALAIDPLEALRAE